MKFHFQVKGGTVRMVSCFLNRFTVSVQQIVQWSR